MEKAGLKSFAREQEEERFSLFTKIKRKKQVQNLSERIFINQNVGYTNANIEVSDVS